MNDMEAKPPESWEEKTLDSFCLFGKITEQHAKDILEILRIQISKVREEARELKVKNI